MTPAKHNAEKALDPGEAYYRAWGWSGCNGSRWETLPPATRDGWRHAEDAQARATSLSQKVDRCTQHLREALGYQGRDRDAGLEALAVQAKRRLSPATPQSMECNAMGMGPDHEHDAHDWDFGSGETLPLPRRPQHTTRLDARGGPAMTADDTTSSVEIARHTHLVEENAEQRDRALEEGDPVQAVCGKVWVPSRNPDAFPLCPGCVEHVRQGVDGVSDRNAEKAALAIPCPRGTCRAMPDVWCGITALGPWMHDLRYNLVAACDRGPCWLGKGHDGDCRPGPSRMTNPPASSGEVS